MLNIEKLKFELGVYYLNEVSLKQKVLTKITLLYQKVYNQQYNILLTLSDLLMSREIGVSGYVDKELRKEYTALEEQVSILKNVLSDLKDAPNELKHVLKFLYKLVNTDFDKCYAQDMKIIKFRTEKLPTCPICELIIGSQHSCLEIRRNK